MKKAMRYITNRTSCVTFVPATKHSPNFVTIAPGLWFSIYWRAAEILVKPFVRKWAEDVTATPILSWTRKTSPPKGWKTSKRGLTAMLRFTKRAVSIIAGHHTMCCRTNRERKEFAKANYSTHVMAHPLITDLSVCNRPFWLKFELNNRIFLHSIIVSTTIDKSRFHNRFQDIPKLSLMIRNRYSIDS